ncbi:uncharacterized protein LOC143276465 [Babylonia areolata]|uniref:uncharacterized protein LOC143276465 n=1 Tax=Babylonia areolata TaxID=304850 RepID=UPI003FD65EDB
MEHRSQYACYLCCYLILCLTCICQEVQGVRCYSCHYENLREECLTNEVTCGINEICVNVVYKRPLLGIVYSKGCQDRTQCHSVQSANENRLCDSSPSECAYCCEEDLCNDANRAVTSYFSLTFFVISSLLLTRITYLPAM